MISNDHLDELRIIKQNKNSLDIINRFTVDEFDSSDSNVTKIF
ncbi:hypothetical protein [Spiroplasma clarkii]|nr:hypothetical protein [Spiroplasma clarkii]